MARTEHLPLYKSAYDLCLYFEQVVRKFSRYEKYTLGGDLRDGGRRALNLVVRANARYDKAAVLLELRGEPVGWVEAPRLYLSIRQSSMAT